MNESASLLCDENLAVLELQRDLLFQKIPQYRIKEYVDLALSVGRREADRRKGIPLDVLCSQQQLKVELSDRSPGMGGLNFRAQISYSREEAQVTVYRHSVFELTDCINDYLPEEKAISIDTARDMIIAHEYFHYLEFSNIGEVADLADPVEITPLLWRRRTGRITRCGEVAAHAFAKTYMGLSFLPNLTDYLYLLKSKTLTETQLAEKLAAAQQLYECNGT